MPLYVWRDAYHRSTPVSATVTRYDVMVVADSEAEARKLAVAHYQEHLDPERFGRAPHVPSGAESFRACEILSARPPSSDIPDDGLELRGFCSQPGLSLPPG